MQYVLFCIWLTTPHYVRDSSVLLPRTILSFSLLYSILLYDQAATYLSICSGGRSGCFQQRVIINNAALNILVWNIHGHDTAGKMPKVEIVGPCVCLCGWNPLIVKFSFIQRKENMVHGLCLYQGDRPVCKN